MKKREIIRIIGVSAVRFCVLFSMIFLIAFLVMLFAKGGRMLSIPFLTQFPKYGMTRGGIFPALVGTFYLTSLAIIISLPIGLFSAIYLTEYARPAWLVRIIRTAINTLAGVPSIVFGLFGMAIFVNLFDFGVSILSGSLTLAILILPIIINASEEAIKGVPGSFREASYAVGATKRQTIMRVTLPAALPNILTGAIISVGRAAGETAPILFTAATFYTRKLPRSVMDEVMALPYHIYALMTEGTSPEYQVPIAYGTAIVLLLLVLGINLIAIIIRYRIRRKKKW
ncbi:MAG: phosphate ABC transporter permease PstA [Spirochaetes bacterium]|nr:phosphate ABC transporter permease PstA [Spirochaetota bacterium]